MRAETTSEKPEVKAGPLQSLTDYIRDVRVEMSKVTWPTRRETLITTAMVMLMSVVAALFFLGADWVISKVVTLVLGLAR